jgi:hypothetical protein
MPWGLSFTWTCLVFTLKRPVLHLEVFTPQEPLLLLDLSTLQRPVLHPDVSTQGPELHLNVSSVYTTESCAAPERVYSTWV